MIKRIVTSVLVTVLFSTASIAQNNNQGGDSTIAGIEKYRQALADANPAELWEARGEEMWKQPAGPKNASFEKCDLGLGAGVVKGVYAILPKYFADTDKVQDLESRLVTCMGELQGIAAADATKVVFGSSGVKTDMEALVAYVAGESRNLPIKVSLAHPKEKMAYEVGKKMFFYRGGTHDFGCVTCHGADNSRIRLQDLPNLSKKEPAQRAYSTWPAYRVSQGEVRSFQWRLFDCFRQQRFPQLAFGSEGSVALTMFLAYNANGGALNAPAIKR